MHIRPFAVEEWMNAYETGARYNIAETCVDSVSPDELFALTGEDPGAFWRSLGCRRLTYGDIEGSPAFREGVCRLYRTLSPEHVLTTHGAAGANHHVFYSLVEPGERVISIAPSYQRRLTAPISGSCACARKTATCRTWMNCAPSPFRGRSSSASTTPTIRPAR